MSDEPVKPAKDSSIMPFGQYEGKKIGDVPADYLLWCREQPWMKKKHPEIFAYIEQGRRHLEKEKGDTWRLQKRR